MNRLGFIAFATAIALCACSEKKEIAERQPVKVRTIAVEGAATTGGQAYSGTIEEQSGTTLSFATMGTLKSINVNEGQTVKAGQLIATVDETLVRNAYEAALAAKEQALDAEARLKQLHDAGSLPEIKWIEVQTQVRQATASERIARKGLSDTKLYAPFGGYIAQKQAEAGQSVAPGVPVVKLVKIDQVKVKINIPEDEIARVRVGQQLQVSVAALGGRTFSARITEKGVSADPLSRSYEVKAVINNAAHELLPGMIAEVKRASREPQSAAAAVAIPASIVQIDADNEPFVWTVADGKARKSPVTLGENIGNMVFIASGLQAGDRVICEGQQKVSSGMEVKCEE